MCSPETVTYRLNREEIGRVYHRYSRTILLHVTNPSQHGHLEESYRACLLLRHGFVIKWIQDTWWGYWRKGDDHETMTASGRLRKACALPS
jgi:hypothetical protein